VSAAPAAAPRSAQGTVRRLIVFTILFVLVVVAATGVSGLLGRLFETRPDLGGTGGLALSLAFTLVGGPLAVIVWWLVWRRLDGADRSSVAWGLYLAAISIVSLVTFTTALLGMLASLIGGDWSPEALGTGVTWFAVWLVHRLMWAHPAKSPLRLASVPLVLGAVYGLVVGATGTVRALDGLFHAALLPGQAQAGLPWWTGVAQSAVWAVGGALVWWWHWVREGVRSREGGFADVMLVLSGVLAPAVVALGGAGTALFVGLRAAFDRSDPWSRLLDPLPLALAAAAVGAVVWLYHRRIAQSRSAATSRSARLVEAGVGLVGAASGIGVVVNALLASLTSPLAGTDVRSLLLGGLAALLVGAPVWWLAWRSRPVSADAGATGAAVTGAGAAEAGAIGRRVYLVVVFGVSAVVAIVALLVVGYRIFEFVLEAGGESLIERIRAPFGLLLATGLVAGYHFAVWRRDRAAAPAASATRSIDRVVLVSGPDADELARTIASVTGAAVTRWTRAAEPGSATAFVPLGPDAVARALDGIQAHRVLVVVDSDGGLDVIPLAD